jgi:hypothetical protein
MLYAVRIPMESRRAGSPSSRSSSWPFPLCLVRVPSFRGFATCRFSLSDASLIRGMTIRSVVRPTTGDQVKESFSLTSRPPDSSSQLAISRLATAGFTARLSGISLLELVRLQGVAQTSGVFRVLSAERSGALHFVRGLLFHAETPERVGDAAVLQILSWVRGEFTSSEEPLAQSTSVVSPLESLLSRALDAQLPPDVRPADVRPAGTRRTSSTGIRRRAMYPSHATSSDAIEERDGSRSDQPPPSTRDLRAVATPGIAAAPAPRRTGKISEARPLASVLVAARGDVLEGQGEDAEGLAARVSYLTRLAELIGQTMGSGEARSLRIRTSDTELVVERQPDGRLYGRVVPCEGSNTEPPSTRTAAAPGAVAVPDRASSTNPTTAGAANGASQS